MTARVEVATTTCSRCGHTAPKPVVQGVLADAPNGWADLTLAERGAAIANLRLWRTWITDSTARAASLAADHNRTRHGGK